MVGFFETTFVVTVYTALPPDVPYEKAIALLHDGETLSSMSEYWRSSKRISRSTDNKSTIEVTIEPECEYWEVCEDVPIPKWLFSGTTKYIFEFIPTIKGCDITIRATSLFTSKNNWQLVRGQVLESGEVILGESEESGWLLQTVSASVCNRTFAGFIKGHMPVSMKSVHARLIARLQGIAA